MFALTFQGTVWQFPIAPDGIEVSYPARTAVTPTLNSAYVDMFGQGVGSVTISGTTGWGVGPRKRNPNGITVLRQLVKLYEQYLAAAFAAADPSTVVMTFADGYVGNTFVVVPDPSGLRTSQNKGSPLLIRFSLTLIVIRDTTGGRSKSSPVGATGLARDAAERMAAGLGDAMAALRWADGTGSLLAKMPANAPMQYTVQSGDTLDIIAAAFGVPPQKIRNLNGIRFANRLQTGAVLQIPNE